MIRSLQRLLRPRSIAVFGGREAARVIEQCDKLGFDGEIWPVHRQREEQAGRRCFRSVAELPAAPDAAFIGVNRQTTVEIVAALANAGAGGAVCYASGFRETAARIANAADLQQQLVTAAAAMPIIGPNCYGFVNALDAALLWPDQHGLRRETGGVAIISQSSNIAISLSMQTRGLPIAYLLTAGNQAQISIAELAQGVLLDDRVSALGLHIEGLSDVTAFEQLALLARELNKPIVVLKVGRSETAQQAALSHTAALAGNGRAFSALLQRLGIGEVQSLPELLETLKLLHVHGPLAGRDICAISCSGGEASLVADAVERHSLHLRPLTESQKIAVGETLNEMVNVANPLDYHTFIWGDEARLNMTFSAMLQADFDLALLILDFPRLDYCDDADWRITTRAIVKAAQDTASKTAVVATLHENLPENHARWLLERGLAPLLDVDTALTAIAIAVNIGNAWHTKPPPLLLKPESFVKGQPCTLDEFSAKRRLADYGLVIPEGYRADSVEEVLEYAHRIGFPVTLKGLGIAHKTEAGAVYLNLNNAAAVTAAAQAMAASAQGFLVETMVTDAVAELMIGALNDAVVGPVITLAAGGILVECLDDAVTLTLPTTPETVRAALLSLRIGRLLQGFRGRPSADIDAAVAAVLAVADYLQAETATFVELDINPLLVLPQGRGAVAVDTLLSCYQES